MEVCEGEWQQLVHCFTELTKQPLISNHSHVYQMKTGCAGFLSDKHSQIYTSVTTMGLDLIRFHCPAGMQKLHEPSNTASFFWSGCQLQEKQQCTQQKKSCRARELLIICMRVFYHHMHTSAQICTNLWHLQIMAFAKVLLGSKLISQVFLGLKNT